MSGRYFQVIQGPNGPEYSIDNVAVSKEEFDSRKQASTKEMQEFKQKVTPGLEDLEDFAAQARQRMQKRSMGQKTGGSVKVLKSKISTHKKYKKSSSW